MVRRARVGVAAAAAIAALATSASAADPIPTPIGVGPRFHPGPTSAAVARARSVGRHVCGARVQRLVRAHVELFARRRVVIVPAGIGVAPPLRMRAGFVAGGRCSYPIRTVEPTGVIEFDAAARPTLGDLFTVWGRRLAPDRLLGFSGRVERVRRGQAVARRSARDPASAPRADRARGRRLRAAAQVVPLRGGPVRLATLAVLLGALVAGAAGCGSSNSSPTISVGAAKTYSLADWSLQNVPPGKPARLSFQIDQPSGGPMTRFKTGAGPHTGVHLIIVRQDLGAIVHRHPPVAGERPARRHDPLPQRRALPRRRRRLPGAGRRATSSSSAGSPSTAASRRPRRTTPAGSSWWTATAS